MLGKFIARLESCVFGCHLKTFLLNSLVILANTCLEWVIVFQSYGYTFREHSVPTVLQPLISFTFESIAREREALLSVMLASKGGK